MASDPLYDLSPGDPEFWTEVGDAAESLFVAVIQDDVERRDRKIRALSHAFGLLRVTGYTVAAPGDMWTVTADD